MSTTVINGADLERLFKGGYRKLSQKSDEINTLNVFPVPDGDTGTNMAKTLEGGTLAPAEDSAAEYMRVFSKKTLLCARGNSGVILSQFIRGFAKGCAGKSELSVCDFSDAFNSGVECAYSAVIKPVEGTMLTVLREGGEYLAQNAATFEGFEDCLRGLLEVTKASLAKTPQLLPVLLEAGVVDSGGAGVRCILKGMYFALGGDMPEEAESANTAARVERTDSYNFGPDYVFEYGYCTEFIIQLLNAKCSVESFDIAPLSEYLGTIGESIVAVNDGDIVKIHIHTHTPEKALAKAREYGELLTVKIENMSVQHSEKEQQAPAAPEMKYAVVAVMAGEGLKDYFSQIGVTAFVDGGQTVNPSIEDFISVFKTLNARHIIVLPNNSNVVLAAKQAAQLYKDAAVRVIPTRSYAECYSALSMMDLTQENVEGLEESMTAYLPYVTSGYVTVATRDVSMNGIDVKKGDFIGLDDDNILSSSSDKVSCATELFKSLPDIDDKGVITVFYGGDVTDGELSLLKERLEDEFPDIETGYIYGGQDIYSFIFSIE